MLPLVSNTEREEQTEQVQPESSPPGEITFTTLSFEKYKFAFNPPRNGLVKNDGPTAQGADITYGCVISSLNRPGAKHRYSYRSYELAFPEDITRQAAGQSQLNVFIIADEQAGDRAASFMDKDYVVRVARCRIPATEEAVTLADGHLRNFSADSWLAAQNINNAVKGKAGRQTTSSGGSYEWVCLQMGTIHVPHYYESLGEWGYAVSYGCTAGYYSYVGQEGGGGGGTPGSGEDPSPPCDDPIQLCVDNPGGPSGVDEDEVRKERVKRLLEDFPHALLEIPCEQIPLWQPIAQFEPPNVVIEKIDGLDQDGYAFVSGDWDIQYIQDAAGATINMDYFPITVNELPDDPDTGQPFTSEGFLEHIRSNLDDFFDENSTEFGLYNSDEAEIWQDPDHLGAIMRFDIDVPGPFTQDGSVISSYDTDQRWRFTTIESPADWSHPVSGNREFGYIQNDDGSYAFYTRGVDRIAESFDEFVGDYTAAPSAFEGADELWNKFKENVYTFVQNNPGDAEQPTDENNSTWRPDWDKVGDIIMNTGNRSVTDLGCE